MRNFIRQKASGKQQDNPIRYTQTTASAPGKPVLYRQNRESRLLDNTCLLFQMKLSANHSSTLHPSAPFLKLCSILPYPVRGCNAVLGIIFHFILFPPPSSAILVTDH